MGRSDRVARPIRDPPVKWAAAWGLALGIPALLWAVFGVQSEGSCVGVWNTIWPVILAVPLGAILHALGIADEWALGIGAFLTYGRISAGTAWIIRWWRLDRAPLRRRKA